MASLSEYGDVVRITSSQNYEVLKRDGYAYIAEHKPLAARQYCRDMTIARGRILYEVWDHWHEGVMGYFVPEEILGEAKAYRPNAALAPWPDEPMHVRTMLRHAQDIVVAQFPRVHAVSAKAVAEDAYQKLRRRPMTKRAIEDCVVEHVRRKWTSYDFRVVHMKQKEAETVETVKPRMREVLQSWLPHYVSGESLVDFWSRHDLLDAEDGEGKGRYEDVAFKMPSLFNHGGLESLANLRVVVHARL